MITQQELTKKLNEFINLPSETEWLEFKGTVTNNFSTDKIGKYFSALSNEANLLNKDFAWLIFGIDDKTHNIVGTNYRTDKQRLNSLKEQIGKETTNRHSFVDIHELIIDNKRIIMFQIPPAPLGIPIAFKGYLHGREHESLAALSMEKQDRIRSQQEIEWSARIVENATIEDLDKRAIEYARKKYKEGNERKYFYNDIDSWSDKTFLNKIKITLEGKITNTALLLLGKPEAKRLLSTSARITYIYINSTGIRDDSEHFDPPFLLESNNILERLRHKNSKFKILPTNETLTPIENYRYDNWVIREALNNCIAHQDYSKKERIIVTEKSNYELKFKNAGTFYY